MFAQLMQQREEKPRNKHGEGSHRRRKYHDDHMIENHPSHHTQK